MIFVCNMDLIEYNDGKLKYTIKVDKDKKTIYLITQTYNEALCY